jgi:hypothetical protein
MIFRGGSTYHAAKKIIKKPKTRVKDPVLDIRTVGKMDFLQVDGAEVAPDVGPVVAMRSNGGLYVGIGETSDTGTFFCGLMDDVRSPRLLDRFH